MILKNFDCITTFRPGKVDSAFLIASQFLMRAGGHWHVWRALQLRACVYCVLCASAAAAIKNSSGCGIASKAACSSSFYLRQQSDPRWRLDTVDCLLCVHWHCACRVQCAGCVYGLHQCACCIKCPTVSSEPAVLSVASSVPAVPAVSNVPA